MKKIVENNVLRKIIIIPVIVFILLTFAMPTVSRADDDDTTERGLMDWIINIVTSIPIWLCDVANQIIKMGVQIDPVDGVVGNALKAFDGTVYRKGNEDDLAQWLGENPTIGSLPDATVKLDKDIDGYSILKLSISPGEIFANKLALLDADYFSTDSNSATIGNEEYSLTNQLKHTIASWYKAFRLISIVGLLSVLVYLGIRIIISAAASDKAKYKSMFADWVVALCLIFFLHYIMAFTNTMVKQVLGIMGNTQSTQEFKQVNITVQNADGSEADINGEKFEFSTSLMGYVRLLCESISASGRGVYSIMYIALTGYTLYFIIIYIKRALILTVLTMIAPLIALTYPIDKVKDGQAQAFTFWLREYVMNSIQPIIHLTLYTVLVSSAMNLAVASPIYAICALAFIVPGEKLIKEMFGFRSSTAPSLGKMTAAHTLANWITKKGSGGSPKASQQGGAGQNKIRTTDQNPTDSSLVQGSGLDALSGIKSTKPAIAPAPLPGNKPKVTLKNKAKDMVTSVVNKAKKTGAAIASGAKNAANTARHPIQSGAVDKAKKKLGGVANNTGKYLRKKYNIPKGHTIRELAKRGVKTAGKGIVRGIGAGSGAVLGLAGGLVSGDMSTALAGMAAGAKAGDVVGKRALNGASRAREFVGSARYGSKEFQNMEADRAFKNDAENRQHLLDSGVSKKDLDERMEEYAEYRRTGVTDIKEMDKIHDIREEMRNSGLTDENARNQAMELAKLSTKYNSETFRDNEKRTNAEQALARKFLRVRDQNGNKKLNAQQARMASKATMDRLARIKGE